MARAKAITKDHQVEIDYYLDHAHGVALWLNLLYSLLLDTGLRISEAICLPFGVFWKNGELERKFLVDGRIRKGEDALTYEVTLSDRSMHLLQKHANKMNEKRLFGADKPIFPGQRGAPHLSKATASRHLKRLFLGVFNGVDHGYKPHSPRRTKVTDMNRSGAKLEECQYVLGHKWIGSTIRYIEIDPDRVSQSERKVYRERDTHRRVYHVKAVWRQGHPIVVQRPLFSDSVGQRETDATLPDGSYKKGIERAVEVRRAEKIQGQISRFNSGLPKAKPKPKRRKPPDWVSTTE